MARHLSEPPVYQLVMQRVKRLRKGSPFSIRCFAELGTSTAISKAAAQLDYRGQIAIHKILFQVLLVAVRSLKATKAFCKL
ncbi:hypothetical protein FQ186_28770 [Pseudomonas sp. ANT_H14]|nr:hypothetical protein FQ186_28770 [Pseudomonas sp. ANT_H14]KAA0946288.1 hypothetical protein FQ182_14035 [Pseudomonas sp. ANT_H4]